MRSRWLGFLLAVVAVGISIWAWPRLPDRVPTHWNLRGEPDGYSARIVAVTLAPAVLLGLAAVMQILPKIDPKRDNFPKYSDSYWIVVNAILMFLLAIHIAIVGTGLGAPISMGKLVPIGIGLLFVVLGSVLADIEPNWFMGIRTPWTLSSERVWRKTHETGGRLFVIAGVVIIVVGFFEGLATIFVTALAIAVAAVVPIVRSYVLWRKERGRPSE